ncbi:hypothetical protein J4221_02720 [Candidatus Pacearchaeota archaeon]|nr:hypothetical protein [Candidatus Pacearchaeota archaeon]
MERSAYQDIMKSISQKFYTRGMYQYYFIGCEEGRFKFQELHLVGGVARTKEFSLEELKELVPEYSGLEQKTGTKK